MPFRDLDAYIKQARRANSDRELFSCSEAAARQLGLPWLAIVQSMAFFQPGGRYFRMDNFQSWGDVFVAEGYYRDDPALLAARSTSRAFCWHEMERLLGGFTRRQARIVREAARHGLRNGLTVPIGVAGEPPGCCTFATRDGQLPPSHICRIATLMASEAFTEARRLHGFPARPLKLPHLSPKRLECFRLAAMGKSDVEIGIMIVAARLDHRPAQPTQGGGGRRLAQEGSPVRIGAHSLQIVAMPPESARDRLQPRENRFSRIRREQLGEFACQPAPKPHLEALAERRAQFRRRPRQFERLDLKIIGRG